MTTNCVWHASEFEACPTECGLAASTLERVVECVDPADTSLVVEHARCNFEDKLDEEALEELVRMKLIGGALAKRRV